MKCGSDREGGGKFGSEGGRGEVWEGGGKLRVCCQIWFSGSAIHVHDMYVYTSVLACFGCWMYT